MSIVRLIVAWLVMAALPLQGIAAASMLFCDQAAHSTTQQQPAHDHASHGHDHASHAHGGHDDAAAAEHGHEAVADQGGDWVHVAQAGHDAGAKASSVGDDHSCPICASCCNLVALSELPTLSLDSTPPMAPPLQGPSRVTTREAPAPDKPPRA